MVRAGGAGLLALEQMRPHAGGARRGRRRGRRRRRRRRAATRGGRRADLAGQIFREIAISRREVAISRPICRELGARRICRAQIYHGRELDPAAAQLLADHPLGVISSHPPRRAGARRRAASARRARGRQGLEAATRGHNAAHLLGLGLGIRSGFGFGLG